MIEDEVQRQNTERKLNELQEQIRLAEAALADERLSHVDALSLSSLKRMARQLTEELASYQASQAQPVGAVEGQ